MTRAKISPIWGAGARPRLPLLRLALAGTAAAATGGCVQVSAPTEPIVIDLNINIRQEVVVRLQDDARQLIERERGVF